MADPGAGALEEVAAAAPHAHRQLHVLAAPDVHGGVEGPHREEVLAVHGEGAPDHGRGGEGRRRRLGERFNTKLTSWVIAVSVYELTY